MRRFFFHNNGVFRTASLLWEAARARCGAEALYKTGNAQLNRYRSIETCHGASLQLFYGRKMLKSENYRLTTISFIPEISILMSSLVTRSSLTDVLLSFLKIIHW